MQQGQAIPPELVKYISDGERLIGYYYREAAKRGMLQISTDDASTSGPAAKQTRVELSNDAPKPLTTSNAYASTCSVTLHPTQQPLQTVANGGTPTTLTSSSTQQGGFYLESSTMSMSKTPSTTFSTRWIS